MNNEMIERVAKIIFEIHWECPWNTAEGYEKDHYLKMSKEVIEAMRTPTDQQRNNYYELSHNTETFIDAHWERAIDAILK